MALAEILSTIEGSSVGVMVRESTWMFPTFESLHVLAIVLVVGTIAIIDLRLLGFASSNRSITELHAEVLPWTWVSFAFALITGALLFASAAVKYSGMFVFQMKLLLIVLAGINMLFFQFVTYRSVAQWDKQAATPGAAKIAGGLSLTFWVGVVGFGRWIGFV